MATAYVRTFNLINSHRKYSIQTNVTQNQTMNCLLFCGNVNQDKDNKHTLKSTLVRRENARGQFRMCSPVSPFPLSLGNTFESHFK